MSMVLILFATAGLHGQADKNAISSYHLSGNSEMWLEGSANVTDYSCDIQEMNASIKVGNINSNKMDSVRSRQINAGLKVKVDQIDCGKKKMNSDMKEALKADQYPFIRFELKDAKRTESVQMAQISQNPSLNWFDIEVTGDMTIGGETRTITFQSEGRPVGDNRFRVRGEKRINMKDFDVTPPTAMFGLIKAEKWLTVHFDFTVGPDAEPS